VRLSVAHSLHARKLAAWYDAGYRHPQYTHRIFCILHRLTDPARAKVERHVQIYRNMIGWLTALPSWRHCSAPKRSTTSNRQKSQHQFLGRSTEHTRQEVRDGIQRALAGRKMDLFKLLAAESKLLAGIIWHIVCPCRQVRIEMLQPKHSLCGMFRGMFTGSSSSCWV
jgi:hypothetical protein